MKKIYIVNIVLCLVLGSVLPVLGHGEKGGEAESAKEIPSAAMDLAVSLRIPALSPWFIETPVAAVNGEPIVLGEFARDFQSGKGPDAVAEKFAVRLKGLIAEKLKAQGAAPAGSGDAEGQVETFAVPESIKDQTIELQAPIFSPLFVDTPVAVVNGEAILFGDFAQEIISMYSGMSGEDIASHDYEGLLKRLISVKLIVEEARNIGLNETEGAVKEISTFADKALAKALLMEQSKEVVPVKSEVDEAYRMLSQEVKLMTIQVDREEDAQTLLEKYQAGGDFADLAKALVEEGKASLSEDEEYVHIKELLPQIKADIAEMKVGDVSRIFKASSKGYLVFKLIDRRFVEDPEIFQEVQRKNLEKERAINSQEYIKALEEKYVRYNEEAMADLDFENLKKENPDLALRDYLQQLKGDQRLLVTFDGSDEVNITVAEIAEKIQSSFYHGLEESVTAAKLNEEKDKALYNRQFQITSRLEAERLGLDKARAYVEEVEDFTTTLLFERFLEQVIAPEVSITEEEVRRRYEERLSEFSSPVMLKMKGLVFRSPEDAKLALEKLESGSDFKWVSANSSGMVEKDAEGVLPFEGKLLSVTALPEALQSKASNARKGDALFYADPGKYYYVLFVDAAFAPQPESYEKVRSQVGTSIYNEKMQEILDNWVDRLREVYETEIFLVAH